MKNTKIEKHYYIASVIEKGFLTQEPLSSDNSVHTGSQGSKALPEASRKEAPYCCKNLTCNPHSVLLRLQRKHSTFNKRKSLVLFLRTTENRKNTQTIKQNVNTKVENSSDRLILFLKQIHRLCQIKSNYIFVYKRDI